MFVLDKGVLKATTGSDKNDTGEKKGTSAERTRQYVKLHWKVPEPMSGKQSGQGCKTRLSSGPMSWSAVLDDIRSNILTISGMAFQDVWNLELSRLKRCCVHVVTAEKKMVPFCAYYLTAADGKRLYGRKHL
ncbi:MAG: hypothetical protein SV686_17145 [Thermodesulfobacteriota bacterium]|nr:hypothetical protein [Thermodesulfobacteriota bacterium]